MKNRSFHPSFITLALVALVSGTSSIPGLAMDHSTVDMEPHLAYLRKTLDEHKLHPCHFCLAEKDESVKIFDLQKHTDQRALEIHASHPKGSSFEYILPNQPTDVSQPIQAKSSWWDMLPTMPRFSSLWSTPVPETKDSSPLTVSSFYIIPSDSSTSNPIFPLSASNPTLQFSSSENTPLINNYGLRSSETEPIELGLSLMGGGGRGYMTALWLKRLMDEAKAPIWQIFPCVAGVSIGAILGLGLANPKIEISEFDRFFTTDFDQVFPQESYWNIPVKVWDSARSILYPQYPAGPLEILLRERNGSTTMNEMRTDVVATAINTKTNELRIFNRDTDGLVPLWEVARASSAAPTKFKAYEINGIPYIDGGIGENNPVLRLLMRMRELSQQRKQSFSLDTATVLSLGTGEMPVDSIPNDAGLSSAGRIINACMDVQSNAAETTAKSLVKNFISINPKLSKMIPLDILDDETRTLLREAAETKYEDIEKFAHLDVVQRQLERHNSIF